MSSVKKLSIQGEQVVTRKRTWEDVKAEYYATAVQMLNLSMSIGTIQSITNLTENEIRAIAKENNIGA